MVQETETSPLDAPSGTGASQKLCAHCRAYKPLNEFIRRTGRRSGKQSRRGACRECRKHRIQQGTGAADPLEPAVERLPELPEHPELPVLVHEPADPSADGQPAPAAPAKKRKRKRRRRSGSKKLLTARVIRPLPAPPPRPEGPDASVLVPSKEGIIWMQGRTDKGRRWRQETDLETAVTLVNEHAAFVVNRRTIRRLYSNRAFRSYILTRDRYTCYFCGQYGDTIDHLLPRAKGGHTTPMNCVCACNLCNQSKADRDLDEFMGADPS